MYHFLVHWISSLVTPQGSNCFFFFLLVRYTILCSFSNENSQKSISNTQTTLPSLYSDSPCSCSVLHLHQATMPSQHDTYLRPRPNTKWQNLENERFVDQFEFDELDHGPQSACSVSDRHEVRTEVILGIHSSP